MTPVLKRWCWPYLQSCCVTSLLETTKSHYPCRSTWWLKTTTAPVELLLHPSAPCHFTKCSCCYYSEKNSWTESWIRAEYIKTYYQHGSPLVSSPWPWYFGAGDSPTDTFTRSPGFYLCNLFVVCPSLSILSLLKLFPRSVISWTCSHCLHIFCLSTVFFCLPSCCFFGCPIPHLHLCEVFYVVLYSWNALLIYIP